MAADPALDLPATRGEPPAASRAGPRPLEALLSIGAVPPVAAGAGTAAGTGRVAGTGPLAAVRGPGRLRAVAALLRPAVAGALAARGPGQLRDQLLGRCPVRLRPCLGDRAGQPDGHAGAVPVREGRRGDRPGPARAVPRLPAPGGVAGAVGAGGAGRDGHRPGRVRRC